MNLAIIKLIKDNYGTDDNNIDDNYDSLKSLRIC